MKQNGFSIALVFVAIAIVGISGALTYVGLQQVSPKNNGEQVNDNPKVAIATEDKSIKSVASKSDLKPGALASTIGEGFIENLTTCTASSTTFTHPFDGNEYKRIIKGKVSDDCKYVETMPNNGTMTCNLNDSQRKDYVAYLTAVYQADDVQASSSSGTQDSSSGETVIDGKTIKFDPNTFVNDGSCVVSGY